MTDVARLSERISASGIKKVFLADKCGLTYQGLLNKLDGKTEFNVTEARALKDALGLTNKEAVDIFFAN